MDKRKLIFAPGAFDDFTGTQEELDEFIRLVTAKMEEGVFQEDFGSDDPENNITEAEFEEMSRKQHEARLRTLH